MSCGSWDGIAEPDSDRGDIDGAVEDVLAFVVAGGHGAELFELVDAAFDNVAAFVGLGVECGWPPALTAPPGSVGLLAGPFGNDGLDPASAQLGADGPAGVGLVSEQPVGSGAGRPRRRMRMPAITGSKATASWRCPGVVTREIGRPREAAAR